MTKFQILNKFRSLASPRWASARGVIWSLVIVWLLGFGHWSLGWAMGEAPKLETVDFSLPDLSGKVIKLSDFRGKVVFLNFWATWCPPCRQEMPSMKKLYGKLRNEDFEMLAVSIDKPGKSVVKPFVEKGGYTFKILLDPEGRVASQYGIVSIPMTFIIDRKGKIIDKTIGTRDWAEESIIQKFRNILK